MKRRQFLEAAASGAVLGAVAVFSPRAKGAEPGASAGSALRPPAKGFIHVAFAISEGVNVIDLAGAWEVFQDVMIPSRGPSMEEQMPFRPFTVSETKRPVKATGGLTITPDFTYEDTPRPQVVVVPAQAGTPRLSEWLRAATKTSDVTMSVCTGAFKLAKAGLLAGKSATTHHEYLDAFAKQFPDVKVGVLGQGAGLRVAEVGEHEVAALEPRRVSAVELARAKSASICAARHETPQPGCGDRCPPT